MRTAIIGGSFNPPHIGHLQLAEEVRLAGFERIFFIPSNISSHKKTPPRPDAGQRLLMTRLAADLAKAFVEDCEIQRGGVSYTVDTLKHLAARYQIKGRPAVVIGDDLLENLHLWKDAGELEAMADILVARRNCPDAVNTAVCYKRLDNIILPVSSSIIRQLRSNGKAYKFLVPLPVFDYIEEHDLYKEAHEA